MAKDKVNILVVFYSMTGNVAKLAKAVAEGAQSVRDTEVRIRQVEEIVPKEKWNDVMKKVKEDVGKKGAFVEKEIKELPTPDYVLGAKDILVVVGDSKDIEVLEKHIK